MWDLWFVGIELWLKWEKGETEVGLDSLFGLEGPSVDNEAELILFNTGMSGGYIEIWLS